jgi:rRNA maturation endonuclease Nob1
MDGNTIGKALAAATGDLRDWPERCLSCGNEDLVPDTRRDTTWCKPCGTEFSREVLYQDRLDRAYKETGVRP